MAWLSRVNFISSDTLSFTDINNLGNDIRAWGDNVNGGGYTLSNVAISASSGTMGLVIGGTGTTSTLRLRSTSGVGTTGADIIFQAGNNGATEVMRLQNNGNVGIGTASNAGNTLRYLDLQNTDTGSSAGAIIRLITSNSAGTGSNTADLVRYKTGLFLINNNDSSGIIAINNAGSERMRIDTAGNVKVGGTADRATTVGTNQVVIFNGTAPVGTLTNGCSFYSTAGEMRVMDAAGNATLLSPHDSATNEWIYDSSHTPSGKRLKINVERLLRFINDHFGLDCVHDFMEEA
jgi:hypothetical protein